MNSKFKYIEVLFENVEVLRIPYNCVIEFSLSGYKRSFERIAVNGFHQFEVYENVLLAVSSSLDKSDMPQPDLFSEYDSLIDFLSRRDDIVSFEVIFEDENENFRFYVDYEEASSYLGAPNKNEKIYQNKDRDVLISIFSDDEKFGSFVDEYKEVFESDDYKQTKEMFDILE